MLFIENLKKCTQKLLELVNSAKLQNTKSIYKYQLFLYTNNQLSEREIKKAIPFTTVSKRIKYLGINLTKEVQGLGLKEKNPNPNPNVENLKIFMEETEDYTNKRKEYSILIYWKN